MLCLLLTVTAHAADTIATPDIQATLTSGIIKKPTIFSVSINQAVNDDIEAIIWPDGTISLPVKRTAHLLELAPQESLDTKTLFYADPYLKQSTEVHWDTGLVQQGNHTFPNASHPPIRVEDSFLEAQDVFLEQSQIEALFDITLTIDTNSASVTLRTQRPLKKLTITTNEDDTQNQDHYEIVSHPEIIQKPIEHIYLSANGFSNFQVLNQSATANSPAQQIKTDNITNSLSTGIQGTLFHGINYYVKPSFIRFNGKTNFQNVDWMFEKEGERFDWKLGNLDAGLSTLVSPSLPLWGFKFATKNAALTQITPLPYRVYKGDNVLANTDISLVLNDQVVQTIHPKKKDYEFEPVYLQGQALNHIKIVTKDSKHAENLLLQDKVSYFPNVLAKKEIAFSTFIGRSPLQFEPVLLKDDIPVLMPQSNKWLVGGRAAYGLTNRLTLSTATAANHVFGTPKTFFLNPNPFAQDLTGFVSYQRDPNFMQGEAVSLSARYQLGKNFLLFSDAATSLSQLKSGSTLTGFKTNQSGQAGKAGVQFQSQRFNAQIDAFHYDTYYYSPDSLFNSYLYDKEGIGAGINGSIPRFFNLSYQGRWDHYQTNLEHIMPGGYINVNHWRGSASMTLSKTTFLNANLDLTQGENDQRELTQEYGDISLEQKLPLTARARVRLTHQLTDFFILPNGGISISNTYKNDGVETSLDVPVSKSFNNRIQVGHMFSTFVNYYFAKGSFQYKRVFTELALQKSYGNKQQLLDNVSLRLGYQFKSGRKLSCAYVVWHNQFQFPGSQPSKLKMHQFLFDFNDVFGLIADRFHSVGSTGEAFASLSGKVYVDINQNGQLDPNEPGVSDINLVLDNDTPLITDKEGNYVTGRLNGGHHTLALQPETLPVFLNMETPGYRLTLKEGKNHRHNIGVIPQGGTLSGKVIVKTIQERPIIGNPVLLVLLDKEGSIITYTTPEADGSYRFTNLAPGYYQVDIEPKLKASGKYTILANPQSAEIKPSLQYDQPTEVSELNFSLLKVE